MTTLSPTLLRAPNLGLPHAFSTRHGGESVGAYAGSEIMAGLLHVKVPLLARRIVTLIPALVILALGAEPTWALVLSQVVLSFGIPLAIIPLMKYTRDRQLMGPFADGVVLRSTATVIAVIIVALNAALIVLTAMGLG